MTPGRSRGREIGRAIAVALAVVLFVVAIRSFLATLTGPFGQFVGVDAARYVEHASWWLAGRSPYMPHEVAGPFVYSEDTFLHPPLALPLFAAFTILPLPLFWAIPLSIIGWSIRRAPTWTWPLLAAALAWPRTQGALIVGNTDMWVAAFAAAGVRYGWPAVLVAVKPSLFPLAFTGALHRSWWVAGVAVAVACIPFGALWLDWLAVIRNSGVGLDYSLLNAPFPVAVAVASIGDRWSRGLHDVDVFGDELARAG